MVPIEPVSATLATIALLFPVYDACDRICNGIRDMKTFGKDIHAQQIRLGMQWFRLYQIMHRDYQNDLVKPPDPNDKFHEVTSKVLQYLGLIKLEFDECHAVLKKFDNNKPSNESDISGIQSSLTILPTPSLTTGSTALASGALNPSNDSTADSSKITNGSASPSSRASDASPTTEAAVSAQRSQKKKREWRMPHWNWGKHSKSATALSSVKSTSVSAPTSRQLTIDRDPPIHQFQSTAVEEAAQAQVEEARAKKDASTLWQRTVWSNQNKQKLEERLEKIRRDINTLDEILKCKTPNDSGRLLAMPNQAPTKTWTNHELQSALVRLHETLRTMKSKDGNRGSWSFSVQLFTNHDMNKKTLEGGPKCASRDALHRVDSFVFSIQWHKSKDMTEKSDFLLIETLKAPTISDQVVDAPPNALEYLDAPSALEPTGPGTGEPYEVWGSLQTPDHPEDSHNVFHEKAKWSSKETMLDLLGSQDFRNRLSTTHTYALARLIVQAHLDFAKVQTRMSPRPNNFRYYTCDDTDEEVVNEGPLYLRPYLYFGLGRDPPFRKPGAMSSIERPSNFPMIELGLLLYQLGSRQTVNYDINGAGAAEGLEEARRNAMINLSSIDRTCGPVFTLVVQICLECQYSELVERKDESSLVEKVLTRLVRFQEALGQSAS